MLRTAQGLQEQMKDRQTWLRRSNELIQISDAVRARLYTNVEKDAVGLIVSALLLKGTRTFRAIRLMYMKGLEEQAQALVRVLLETMIDLSIFVSECSQDHTGAVRRVRDSMMLQKVQQARESKWAGFDIFGLDPKDFLDLEQEIKTRYTEQEVRDMRRHGFSGVPLSQRADMVQAAEVYNIVYRNFSRNVHSTDYMEHVRMLGQKQESKWPEYEELRDAVGFSAAATFLWGMAYTAATIKRRDNLTKIMLLIKLDRIAAKFRRIPSWVNLGPVPEDEEATQRRLSGVMERVS